MVLHFYVTKKIFSVLPFILFFLVSSEQTEIKKNEIKKGKYKTMFKEIFNTVYTVQLKYIIKSADGAFLKVSIRQEINLFNYNIITINYTN